VDREAREERNRTFNAALRERVEANKDTAPLRERFIQAPEMPGLKNLKDWREGQEEPEAPPEQEEGEQS
jgi:hypothetical protein